MTKNQKISLVAACIFYVLTIVGFFFFSLTLIVLLFLGFSLSMAYFSMHCYQRHNDYTGAEHLQQEIGMLTAEKEQLSKDYETLVSEKDKAIEESSQRADELEKELEVVKADLEKYKEENKGLSDRNAAPVKNEFESLLPPEEDDDAANVDIIEIARRAIKELEEAAHKAGLRVNISSASDKLMVHASAKRLLIMFRNIIDNSIKYMQKEGTLVITISAIEDDIFIVLKDTGKGLPENETKHIFELNYQGSNRISGNGLGLTQAKAIVEHYGGTIYARSPQGNGMGIYIQLPTT
jgi:signal transduction histidine kinase